MSDLFIFVVASLTTMAGMSLLYFIWKSEVMFKEGFIIASLASLWVAGLFWTQLSGWEFGTIYALTLPSIAALILVASNVEFKKESTIKDRTSAISPPSFESTLGVLAKLFLLLPFSLVASIFVSYGLGMLVAEFELNQMVFAICVLPVFWGAFGYWVLSDKRTLRPVLAISGITVFSVLPIF